MSSDQLAVFTGDIPTNYDRYLGPMLFEPYAEDIVSRMQKDQAKNILELACGTGRVTRHLASLVGEDGRVVATDLNADMIEVGKTKVHSHKITWQVADAQQLPFNDMSFDHVVCQFGMMFFPDKLKACKEVYTVLQKKGKFIFNTWDSLEHNLHSHIVQKVLKDIMKDDAPDFMEKGPFSMYNKDEINELLEEAGFNHIQIEIVQKIAHYESDDNIIKGFLLGSPLAVFINKLNEELRETIKERVAQEIVNSFGKGHHEFPMQALVCSARK